MPDQVAYRPANDTITLEAYERLTDAYIKYRNIQSAANEAGVGASTARRYIEVGSANFPAVKERVSDLTRRALQRSDEAREKQLAFFKGAQVKMTNQLTVLDKIRLVPKGKVNQNGEHEVDEKTFERLGNIANRLWRLGQEIISVERGDDPRPQTTVNVGVQVGSPIDAQRSAEAFLSTRISSGAGRNSAASDRKQRLASAIIAATRVRAGTDDGPRA